MLQFNKLQCLKSVVSILASGYFLHERYDENEYSKIYCNRLLGVDNLTKRLVRKVIDLSLF